MTKPAFEARGVIPACLLPFDHDLAIDAAAFRSHLRDVSRVDGISAVTVNAHSTEVATCTPPCVRVVVAFNEAVKDESKIHSVVQTASG